MKGEVILVPLILLQGRPTAKLIYYSQQFLSSCLLNIILEKKRNLKLSFIYVQLQIGQQKHSNCAVSFTEAQLGGGRPGARPPLAPERGGRAPPCRMKRKKA